MKPLNMTLLDLMNYLFRFPLKFLLLITLLIFYTPTYAAGPDWPADCADVKADDPRWEGCAERSLEIQKKKLGMTDAELEEDRRLHTDEELQKSPMEYPDVIGEFETSSPEQDDTSPDSADNKNNTIKAKRTTEIDPFAIDDEDLQELQQGIPVTGNGGGAVIDPVRSTGLGAQGSDYQIDDIDLQSLQEDMRISNDANFSIDNLDTRSLKTYDQNFSLERSDPSQYADQAQQDMVEWEIEQERQRQIQLAEQARRQAEAAEQARLAAIREQQWAQQRAIERSYEEAAAALQAENDAMDTIGTFATGILQGYNLYKGATSGGGLGSLGGLSGYSGAGAYGGGGYAANRNSNSNKCSLVRQQIAALYKSIQQIRRYEEAVAASPGSFSIHKIPKVQELIRLNKNWYNANCL